MALCQAQGGAGALNDRCALDRWTDSFSAQVGASAALLGLLFVGLSVNLAKIVASPNLPRRALLAMALLLAVLLIGSMLLIPDQSPFLIGIETLCIALPLWAYGSSVDTRYVEEAGGANRKTVLAI